MNKVKEIKMSWVVVSDLKEAIKFYEQVVGLKLMQLSEEFGWAEMSGADEGCMLGIAQINDDEEMQTRRKRYGRNILAFQVLYQNNITLLTISPFTWGLFGGNTNNLFVSISKQFIHCDFSITVVICTTYQSFSPPNEFGVWYTKPVESGWGCACG
jgi:hypothetical protein